MKDCRHFSARANLRKSGVVEKLSLNQSFREPLGACDLRLAWTAPSVEAAASY
jgi:hypothetical protein